MNPSLYHFYKNLLSCGRTKLLCLAKRRKSKRQQSKSCQAKVSPTLEGENSLTHCPPPPHPHPKGKICIPFLIDLLSKITVLAPAFPEREKGKS